MLQKFRAESTGRALDIETIASALLRPGLSVSEIQATATALTSVRPRGSIVQTGLHTKPATVDAMVLSQKDLSLFGSWCFRVTDWPRIIRMIAGGNLPVIKVMTSRISLDEVVTKGFDALVDPAGDQLKILIGAS